MTNKKEIRRFIRFLKDNGMYKPFLRKFYSKASIDYRSRHPITKCLIKKDLEHYLLNMETNRYIFNAFSWYRGDIWSEINDKWMYLLFWGKK